MKTVTVAPSGDGVLPWRADWLMALQLQVGLFTSMVGVGAIDGGSGGTDASSGSRQLIWGGMALLSIGYLIIGSLMGRGRRASYGGWSIALLVIYACSSALWSVDPIVTVKRGILLSILVLICGVSVGQWSDNWRQDIFSKLLAKPMGLVLALSFLFTLFMPGAAFTDIGWRGIASHKNEAGQMMAFAVVLLLYGVCHDKLQARIRFVLLVLVFSALMLAKSTTALLGLLFGVALTEAFTLRSTFNRLDSWKTPFAVTVLCLSCATFLAFQLDLLPSASAGYGAVLDMLGKSETLTGRTAIWDLVLGESRFHNPWLGGGYGAFWVGRNSISGYVLTGGGVLYPGQSHNGYIDIYNDLGFVGLGILGIVLVIWLFNTRKIVLARHVEGKMHCAILFMCVFLNLGESTYLRGTGLMSIVFIASFVRVMAIARQVRLESDQIKRAQMMRAV